MSHEIDITQLQTWWGIYNPDNSRVMEIRLIGRKSTFSGYFKDFDTLVAQMSPYLDDKNAGYYGNLQAYFVLNEINPQLYGREQRDTFVKNAKSTTSDKDIIRRRFVFVDFDSVKAADISASNAELEFTHHKCIDVYNYLKSVGFPEPCVAISGNGYRMTYACDIIPSEETDMLIKSFLEALSAQFSDEHVDIDTKVFNRSRIDKIIGTWAKKGSDDGVDRMWRLARYVMVPEEMKVTPVELFQKIADTKPNKAATAPVRTAPVRGMGEPSFDVEAWLNRHGLEYRVKYEGGITKYQLRKCPWEEQHSVHKEWDSAICKMPDGRLAFTCFHAHCAGKTWHDVRLLYEPHAYDRQMQRIYAPMGQQFVPQVHAVVEIKPETAELGKKWLPPSSIEKINLYDLPKVRTGFAELDRLIDGLHFFEYTVLSGTNGCGKSSWLNTLILNMIDCGEKVALWSGELPAYSLMTWMDMAACGKKHLSEARKPGGYNYFYVNDETSMKIRKWLDGKFVLYNSSYGNKWEQLFSDMEELLTKGFRIFILDNLSAMDVDAIEGDKNKKEKTVVVQLHDFCIEKKCHIILVVHPRKGTARGQRTLLRKEDIAGDGAITNLADNVFIIHRNNNDFRRGFAEFYGKEAATQYEPNGSKGGVGNVIEICKNRMFGHQDSIVDMYYEAESRRFLNNPRESKEYGWYCGDVRREISVDNRPLLSQRGESEVNTSEQSAIWDDPLPAPGMGLPF